MIIRKVPALKFNKRWWCSINNISNPAMTNFMYSLSVLFESGEKFFMKSVTPHFDKLKVHDKDLYKDVIDFCRQEGNHGRLHNLMNRADPDLELYLLKLEKTTEDFLNTIEKLTNKELRLILTCTLEHMTAILAKELLSRPDILEMFDSDYFDAWTYHAVEEDEHKHVSFDVYKRIYGLKSDKLLRILMPFVTLALVAVIMRNWVYLGFNTTFSGTLDMFKVLFIGNSEDGGFITNLKDDWLKWFDKDFHPNNC